MSFQALEDYCGEFMLADDKVLVGEFLCWGTLDRGDDFLVVGFAPANSAAGGPGSTTVLKDACPVKLLDGDGVIGHCAGRGVDGRQGIDACYSYPGTGEAESDEEANWTCADDCYCYGRHCCPARR